VAVAVAGVGATATTVVGFGVGAVVGAVAGPVVVDVVVVVLDQVPSPWW